MKIKTITEWKVGDWCFCEYELKVVKEVEKDGRVSSVSTGYFMTGSHDMRDRMYPLTMSGRTISDSYQLSNKKLHDLKGTNSLNFPDIRRWYTNAWVRAMDLIGDNDAVSAEIKLMHEFEQEIIKAFESHRGFRVREVYLYRQ